MAFCEAQPDPRADLVRRWNSLTREQLPALAQLERWPISQDHCFMRVCLDAVFGRPWHHVVKRPAIQHLSLGQLAEAIAVAELITRSPEVLPELNAQSIAWRRKHQSEST
jgi:hypothetical protein